MAGAGTVRRKGAGSVKAIPADILAALNKGEIETATLAEALAVDLASLLIAVRPGIDPAPLSQPKLGYTARMALAASLLLKDGGTGIVAELAAHHSDTVRGWAAFTIGQIPNLDLQERLALARPLADDPHFGVREWAWLGIRTQIAASTQATIELLTPWTMEKSANLRRFASEATRPRGVWCAHLSDLRQRPEAGLAILEPLRADPERYVQNSVGNWLNDAAKDDPAWVIALCQKWERESPGPATAAIVKRARRNL